MSVWSTCTAGLMLNINLIQTQKVEFAWSEDYSKTSQLSHGQDVIKASYFHLIFLAEPLLYLTVPCRFSAVQDNFIWNYRPHNSTHLLI